MAAGPGRLGTSVYSQILTMGHKIERALWGLPDYGLWLLLTAFVRSRSLVTSSAICVGLDFNGQFSNHTIFSLLRLSFPTIHFILIMCVSSYT